MNLEFSPTPQMLQFAPKVNLNINAGRFVIRTIENYAELEQAFLLRYQVFQIEMIGQKNNQGLDQDQYDISADHLAIFDSKTNQMIATCRLNCSLFSMNFYSEQEFHCSSLISRPEVKLEIGRVCVHKDFRKGIIIMLLWRAIASYMMKTETRLLFGCGSVMTESPTDAIVLYKYLIEENKVRTHLNISPTDKYKSQIFESLLLDNKNQLSHEQHLYAKELLPSLCRSYFDIGCFTPGPPAFDHEFKCIDFLTVLEIDQLDMRLRQKIGMLP